MRSLFAWVTRRPRGSWETHHAGCTQGFPLGTHSHLCQLLLQHLQHHVHDVLVAGISARHALSPGQPGHAAVSSQSSGAGESGVALHPGGARIPAGAAVAGFSADALLSLGPRLARLALLAFLAREAGHSRVAHSPAGPGLSWGALVSLDAGQALRPWNSRRPLLPLGALPSLRAWLPHGPPLTLVTLLPHDALGTDFSSRPRLSLLPRGTRDSREALLAWLTLVSWASFGPGLAWHTRWALVAWVSWPPRQSCTALHARCAWGPVLAVDAWGTSCSLWACYSLGSSNTLASHVAFLASSAWWPSRTFLTRRPSGAHRAHHAFVPTRTRLSFGPRHAWVAPGTLGTRWSRDALLSRSTYISFGTRLPKAAGISQNPAFPRMPLHSLQPLGAFHTRWTVGWTQEIRAAFQALDGSGAARFPRGPRGP